MGLGVRFQKLLASQCCLLVRDTVFVGREEGIVPFCQILALGKKSVELGVDNLRDLRRERF